MTFPKWICFRILEMDCHVRWVVERRDKKEINMHRMSIVMGKRGLVFALCNFLKWI